MSPEDRSGNAGGRIMSRYGVVTLGWLMIVIPTSGAMATCSYDLNGVGYGDNCPYRGPVNRPRPPIYYGPPRVYTPPPVYQPSPAELRHRQATALNQQGVSLFNRGKNLANKGDYRSAANLIKQALNLFVLSLRTEHDATVERNVAFSYSGYGFAMYKQGQLNVALDYYKNAARYAPSDQKIRTDMANLENLIAGQQEAIREKQALAEARSTINSILSEQPARQSAPSSPPTSLNFMSGSSPESTVQPVPKLASLNWSASFPSQGGAAGISISQKKFDALLNSASRARNWLGDSLKTATKSQAKSAAVERAIQSLPVADALKNEAQWQEGLIERYKQLYQDLGKDTKNYLLGFEHVTSGTASCLGSASMNCDQSSLDVEKVANRYADQSENRWQSWVKTDIKSHLSTFFNGSNQ